TVYSCSQSAFLHSPLTNAPPRVARTLNGPLFLLTDAFRDARTRIQIRQQRASFKAQNLGLDVAELHGALGWIVARHHEPVLARHAAADMHLHSNLHEHKAIGLVA